MNQELADINGPSQVTFYKNSSFESGDERRNILGVAGNFGLARDIQQIKLITFNKESVRDRMVVGNHKHYGDSEQWEMLIVLGKTEQPQFEFRYRDYEERIKGRVLMGGEVAIVPPGCSLALIALHEKAMLIEISSKVYHPDNYIIDKLF